MSVPAHPPEPSQDVVPASLIAASACPSCGEPVRGRFCSQCGQSHADVRVPFGKWLRDYLDDTFHLDSKLVRSLVLLVRRPGALTQAYVEGQRSAYVRPFRLYLTVSFLYFLSLSLLAPRELVTVQPFPSQASTAHAVETGAPAEPPREPSLLRRKLERFFAQEKGAAREKIIQGLVKTLPKAMFVLVPVFALLLQLLYRRSGRFYAEHFLFAVHFHSFAFLTLATSLLLTRGRVRPLGELLIAGYLFLALRRVHGQSRARTALKTALLLGSYVCLVLASVVASLFLFIYSLD